MSSSMVCWKQNRHSFDDVSQQPAGCFQAEALLDRSIALKSSWTSSSATRCAAEGPESSCLRLKRLEIPWETNIKQPHSSCLSFFFSILKDVLGIKHYKTTSTSISEKWGPGVRHGKWSPRGINQGPIAQEKKRVYHREGGVTADVIQDACRGGSLCGLYFDVS